MNAIRIPNLTHSYSHVAKQLEHIATRKALADAGMQNIALSYFEKLIHEVFNRLLYFFYPGYTEFYHEKQIEVFTTQGKTPPPYINSSLREGVLFLHRFIASPESIGSAFPSSQYLIHAMTRKISEDVNESTSPRKYLDVGAGTGSFSKGILEKMRPQDSLDIVEYDESLCKLLQRRFGNLPNVKIHNISIFEFSPEYKYDVIVTGLPLNNFTSEEVACAFEKYASLSRSEGSFSYFEYMFFPTLGQTLRKVFNHRKSYENVEKIHAIKQELQNRYPTEIDHVFWNMTPARAIHCKV